MSKHVLVTQVTGSVKLATLSIPIENIIQIRTDNKNQTSMMYKLDENDQSRVILQINISETAGTMANRINAILV